MDPATTLHIIGVEFNTPGINWSNKSLSISYVSKQFQESLVAFTNEFMLEQIVSQPTRGSNILDLCFMSHPVWLFSRLHCDPGPKSSDHDAIIVSLATNSIYRIKY